MKKILIISDTPTHPTNAGNRMCILSYATLLKNIGYDVYFLYITPKKDDEPYIQTKKYWGNHFLYFKKSTIQKIIIKIIEILPFNFFSDIWLLEPWFIKTYIKKIKQKYGFDSIILNYIWLSKIANYFKGNSLLFTHDVFSYRNLRLKGNYWVSCTPNEEAQCINRVNNVLAIQEQEAFYYRYLAYNTNVYCMYCPFPFQKQEITNNKKILFFSGSNILNIEALTFFINNILPSLIKEFPDLELLIGGGICNYLSNNLPKDKPLMEHIVLKGKYDNPADFYKLGDIVINPVSNGTGLKIKTFEALSYGKTVLSSSHSLEGIFKPQQCPVYKANKLNEYIYHLNNIFSAPNIRIKNRINAENYINALNMHIENIFKETL
mgnify:CR=1 FL=1